VQNSTPTTIPTTTLQIGDVLVSNLNGYNMDTNRGFEAVQRHVVVSIDEPAEVLIGIAAGTVRTDVGVRRIKSNGGLGSVRSLSMGDTVTVERA
jgi:hypothetical protein